LYLLPCIKGGGGAAAGVSESDWVSKYEAIKAKLPAYKAIKRELGELEAEVRRLHG
jgi:intraflagellar transport protein 81